MAGAVHAGVRHPRHLVGYYPRRATPGGPLRGCLSGVQGAHAATDLILKTFAANHREQQRGDVRLTPTILSVDIRLADGECPPRLDDPSARDQPLALGGA